MLKGSYWKRDGSLLFMNIDALGIRTVTWCPLSTSVSSTGFILIQWLASVYHTKIFPPFVPFAAQSSSRTLTKRRSSMIRHWRALCVQRYQSTAGRRAHLLKQKLQLLKRMKMRRRSITRRKARTSRLWYWYQVSSWAWTLRCLAPLFLMVNSIQKTASSRGLMGLSWWILDSRITVSQALNSHKVQFNSNCSSFSLHVHHVVWLVTKHGDSHHGNAVVDGLIDPVCSTHVVWLVSKHGDSHHGNAVVDGLIDPVCSTMSDENFCFRPGRRTVEQEADHTSSPSGHPKTKAFITHGGTNGIYEAIYHGVPMVGIPMFGDQPDNMVHMEAKGAAVSVKFNFMTNESLRDAVNMVINNKSYKENVMRLSRIHHDRPMSPRDEAVFWIEFTMRNKGAKHLRVQAHELTWYQYHSLDVLAFLLIIDLLLIFILFKSCSFCFKRCCSRKQTKRKAE
ncbi:hypothetical protein CCH79_00008995 [Gambusia affinis]|uniref:UDP-glycosyltransferases domain-containing protein n=1 Tax=Gambusia affinis TaxID=33528 RepID=A0A315UW11_GAMAF|nr:hypothetical protein CCH79_00008995 [Gambusia affinis]